MDAIETQQTEVLLTIDYAQEQLGLSDVQELLHESRNNSILLRNVAEAEAMAEEWHLLGRKLGWEVRIDHNEVWFGWKASMNK